VSQQVARVSLREHARERALDEDLPAIVRRDAHRDEGRALRVEQRRVAGQATFQMVTNLALQNGSLFDQIASLPRQDLQLLIERIPHRLQQAEAVDRGFRAPAGTAAPQPQPHHAGLRQEEGEEHAHRIERDQAVGAAAEYNK